MRTIGRLSVTKMVTSFSKAIPVVVAALVHCGLVHAALPSASPIKTIGGGCNGPADDVIDSCTRLISSGTIAGQALAAALNSRGAAYYARGQYDLAAKDFLAESEISPSDCIP